MTRTLAILLACLLYSSSAIAAGGGLDEFLHNLNIHAQADPEGFSATLSSQFHVSGTEVRVVLGAVHDPADAFMILQLEQMSRQPMNAVMSVYQNHAGKGWGAIAQDDVGELDAFAARQHHAALERVLQLAHVAGPVVLHQPPLHLVAPAGDEPALLCCEPREKGARQR